MPAGPKPGSPETRYPAQSFTFTKKNRTDLIEIDGRSVIAVIIVVVVDDIVVIAVEVVVVVVVEVCLKVVSVVVVVVKLSN